MNRNNFKIYFFIVAVALICAPKAKAANASTTAFSFTLGQQTFPVSQDQLNSWAGSQTVFSGNAFNPAPQSVEDSLLQSIGQSVNPSPNTQTYNYLLAPVYAFVQSLASQINKPEIDPALAITNGRATTFTAPQTGTQMDVYKTALAALGALQNGNTSATITTYSLLPNKSLAQTNALGINTLIGEGVSTFNGSPHNRRVNIAAGITKFQGIILPQGATFSFDDDLGPVTADAGFLPELVIDNGTTLPELGGGLCQVSTTTFRAAMAAGLPITDRRNHAYAVSYYSPQGTDATIYPGSADLKFVNDTPGSILIWPYEKDSNTLVFDFYGTDDGRKTTLEKPVVYDRQTDGAMKATWTRLVTSAATGQTRTDVFNSNYQPPALFHKTETFVSATGTQTSATH
jgi:vancomycin resistance protein YoaR